MPTYTYKCDSGHVFERYSSLAGFQAVRLCDCHHLATLQITPPLSVSVSPDVCYDSPITGEPITSRAARANDLAKHQCIPYDPEMKKDTARTIQAQEAAMDQSIDTQVERLIEKMPTAQRGQLYSEVVDQGMDLGYHRKGV